MDSSRAVCFIWELGLEVRGFIRGLRGVGLGVLYCRLQ